MKNYEYKLFHGMQVIKYILWIITVAMMVSCAKDNQKNSDVVMESKMGTTFLSNDEVPILKLKIINEEKMVLKVFGLNGQVREFSLQNDSGDPSKVHDYFYTEFCNQPSLVVVLRQPVNTGVSHGYYYVNTVINTKDGKMIKVIEEGEVKDKETGEIISDGQKDTLNQLKLGKQTQAMCKH